jgi:hypothetical protein
MATLRKMPPPPAFLNAPEINRWLIDLQAFILSTGGIDPTQVSGFSTLETQVAVNSANIIATNGNVSTLSGTVSGHTTQINANTSAISTLQARNQILNGSGVPGGGGNNGDLYLNNTGGAGTRLYGKIGGTWVAIA